MSFTIAEGNRCKESLDMNNTLTRYSATPRGPMRYYNAASRPKSQQLRGFCHICPPIELVYFWLSVCLSFCTPTLADYVLLLFRKCALISYVLFVLSQFLRFLHVSYLRHVILEPQSGSFLSLKERFVSRNIDPYLKEAIQVWCLFESIKDARTKRGMVAAITQYLQAHVSESLPLYLYRQISRSEYISDWSSAEGQASVETMIEEAFAIDQVVLDDHWDDLDNLTLDPQTGNTKWYEAVQEAFSNWKQFRSSTVAKRFTHLVNVVVSAGMCSTANLTFKLGNVPLFTPLVSKRQLAAGDVFEAFFEAVSGFLKGGWRVYQTGEVSSFFMNDDKITAFDTAYSTIRSQHGYALAGNLSEYTDIDDNSYELNLQESISLGEKLLLQIPRTQTFERKYVSDRTDRLRDYMTEFTQLRTRGGLRVSPFAVSLFGRSGCGKSSLTNLTVNAGLLYNGLSASKDRIATWADNDKYASSVRSHINAIIFDDFANTKETFMDFSPAYRLIQVINNIRYLAPMADVFLKGKVSLNPYFCVVSTNVEHLNAAMYSNEPESVLRRLYHVVVEPKPELCVGGVLNKELVEEAYGLTACPDAWYLTVRYYAAENKRHVDIKRMVPVEFEGAKMERVPVKRYLRWVQVASKKHFSQERQFLAKQEEAPTPCACGNYYCDCEEILNPESGVVNAALTISDAISEYTKYRANKIKQSFVDMKTSTLLYTSNVCDRFDSYCVIPDRYVSHPVLLKWCLVFWTYDIVHSLCIGYGVVGFVFLFLCHNFVHFSHVWFMLCLIYAYIFTCVTMSVYDKLARDRLLQAKDTIEAFATSWQAKYALIGLGAIALILATIRARRSMSTREEMLNFQTGLDPTNMDEVEARNSQVNPWVSVQRTPLPMSEPSRTATSADLTISMKTNMIGIVSNINKTSLGFFITSNFLLVPTHFLDIHDEDDILVKCYKIGDKKTGSSFRDKLSKSFRVPVPHTDFTLCYITSGGSMKDFRKFLVLEDEVGRVPAKMVTREIVDDELETYPLMYNGTTTVRHTESSFRGSYYRLPVSTKAGMCMSPIISDSKGSTILGFHLGGKGNVGGCGIITKGQVQSAIDALSNVDGVVLSASSGSLDPHMGDFPATSYGRDILESTHIHERSATNFLTEGACIDVYGSTSGKATPYSNVVDTLISPHITEVFGVLQKWGAPKMRGKGKFPYQATLVHAAVPSLPVGSVLSQSVRSMKNLTSGLKVRIPEVFHVNPLSRVETVSGLAGKKFIDPMNFNSSPGFPLSGSKRPWLIDLNPEDYPEVGCPRTFVKEIWDEFESTVKTLNSGRRCYTIWKACLKDEATKLTKDKVRVFQSAPLVTQLLIRMYFLPIVRIIQLNPLLYECAVGVNAEGPEWQELWDHAIGKGEDRILAGDYSKYDIRMPAQVTIAAFDILIDIARHCDGYTSEDIHLMRMIVNEVVYPIMAYNGDLIQLFGTNPSGQNLTVIINSLVNSLLLRSCFFTFYPYDDFKEATAFVTYGDDVFGSVGDEYGLFNHISYANWLAEHDMKFTMPDKESTPTEYMHEKDVDFLKRKCAYNEDLGQKVGLLSEDSIFKRLHSHILSKELTLSMHSAQNIESSLHDWFYYGREIFEQRRNQLSEVAKLAEIQHLCPCLDISYDTRVNRWRHKYLGEDLLELDDDIILDTQCGGDFVVETENHLSFCREQSYGYKFGWEWYIEWIDVFFKVIAPFVVAGGYVQPHFYMPTTRMVLIAPFFAMTLTPFTLFCAYCQAWYGLYSISVTHFLQSWIKGEFSVANVLARHASLQTRIWYEELTSSISYRMRRAVCDLCALCYLRQDLSYFSSVQFGDTDIQLDVSPEEIAYLEYWISESKPSLLEKRNFYHASW